MAAFGAGAASSLFLARLKSLGPRLRRLLLVGADHDHGEERAHDGRPEEDEDNGDADGPDARWEERVERMVVINEWLERRASVSWLFMGTEGFKDETVVMSVLVVLVLARAIARLRGLGDTDADPDEVLGLSHHQQGPDGVVEEDGGRNDEHREADEAVELRGLQVSSGADAHGALADLPSCLGFDLLVGFEEIFVLLCDTGFIAWR